MIYYPFLYQDGYGDFGKESEGNFYLVSVGPTLLVETGQVEEAESEVGLESEV